jgi:hypothetical protein
VYCCGVSCMCGSLIVLTYKLQRSVGNSSKVSSAQSLDAQARIPILLPSKFS